MTTIIWRYEFNIFSRKNLSIFHCKQKRRHAQWDDDCGECGIFCDVLEGSTMILDVCMMCVLCRVKSKLLCIRINFTTIWDMNSVARIIKNDFLWSLKNFIRNVELDRPFLISTSGDLGQNFKSNFLFISFLSHLTTFEIIFRSHYFSS